MKYKTLTVSVLLIIFSPGINAKYSDLPHKCPDVKAVQAVVSNFKVKKYDESYNAWYAFQNNKFDTQYIWTFMISEFQAKNADEAYKKLMTSLSGLRFVGGGGGEDGSVECNYKAAAGIKATAETPPVVPDDVKLMKKKVSVHGPIFSD